MLGSVPAPLGFAAQYDFEQIPCGVEVATDDGAIRKEVRPLTERLLAGRATARTSLAGLVLAGVSVGASGQDRAGAQAQRVRAGARHKGVSLVEPDAALSAPRGRAVSGRTVDLFV